MGAGNRACIEGTLGGQLTTIDPGRSAERCKVTSETLPAALEVWGVCSPRLLVQLARVGNANFCEARLGYGQQ